MSSRTQILSLLPLCPSDVFWKEEMSRISPNSHQTNPKSPKPAPTLHQNAFPANKPQPENDQCTVHWQGYHEPPREYLACARTINKQDYHLHNCQSINIWSFNRSLECHSHTKALHSERHVTPKAIELRAQPDGIPHKSCKI